LTTSLQRVSDRPAAFISSPKKLPFTAFFREKKAKKYYFIKIIKKNSNIIQKLPQLSAIKIFFTPIVISVKFVTAVRNCSLLESFEVDVKVVTCINHSGFLKQPF
jgi:hypothetical protein